MNDGMIISTREEWECRRAEIVRDLETYEVGPKPEPPQVEATYSGGSLSVNVTTDAGSITLSSNVSGSGSCVMIGMDSASSFAGGCRSMTFSAGQVVQMSMMNSDQPPDDPYYTVYPELWEEADNGGSTPAENGNLLVGSYSAWPWGVSRLIDGLEQVQDEMGIDITKIGVHGCSYAGKMALWSGALDQRIALTIAQESGGGGSPSWRASEDYQQSGGGEVESIEDTNWSWFLDSMQDPPLEPHKLPHDHHELVALIAPRAYLELSGDPSNAWLGAHSAYISVSAANEVWKALGAEDNIGWVSNGPGSHCSATSQQSQAANAFVQRFLQDGDADTNIKQGLNDDWQAMVDWDTPTIE